jgi:flagellar FliL protein
VKITVIVLLVLACAVPAGLWYLELPPFSAAAEEVALGPDGEPLPPPPRVPNYMPLEPPFVVNFTHRGTLRYLQLSLDLMFYEADLLAKVEQRMPVIRNDLILLFSNKDFETLSTPGGKEQLRSDILLAVGNVLELDAATIREEGAVYITNFVMQ